MKFWQRSALAALLASTCLALAPTAAAVEVAGISVPDTLRVGQQELVLNGAGVRSKLFIKLYVGALYAPQKMTQPASLLELAPLRRMNLQLLRDIGADTLHAALEEGLANNQTPAELAAVHAAAEQFSGLMRGLGKVREGDSVSLDLSPAGVAVSLNGELRGKVASGPFAQALLKVWLGEKPADAALKKALLGN